MTQGQLKDFLNKQKTQTHKEESTIRIDVKKLDELMNLAGELVLGKNRLILLNNMVKKGEAKNHVLDNLADITNYMEVVTNELQLSVMRARLVPISKLFNKVPRLVRDLSAEFGKEIELDDGGRGDGARPLAHREPPRPAHTHHKELGRPRDRDAGGEGEERQAGEGAVALKAYNEGNNVIIEIYDDGKGIDVEAVKKKAREKGLMGDAELAALSPRDAMSLVFVAGLSTAAKVSNVSGRGVGMDVVRNNVEKMNGQVSIDSEEGRWTRLTLRLPLTLAIMRALIVRVLDELFAIPLNTVTELVKLKEGLIKSVDKKEVLVLRDRVIPVVDLAKVFTGEAPEGEDKYIVICNIGEKTDRHQGAGGRGAGRGRDKAARHVPGQHQGRGRGDDKGGRQGDPHTRHVRPDRPHLFPERLQEDRVGGKRAKAADAAPHKA